MNPQPLLTLRILTPEQIVLDKNQVQAINIPMGDGGSIGIRPGHAPLIAETNQGVVKYRLENEEIQIALYAGVLDIRDNIVTILTAGEVDVNQQADFLVFDKKYERLLQTLIGQMDQEEAVSKEQS